MRFIVVVAVCCASAGCFELDRSSGTGEGKIRFVVRDSAGAPVEGATVFVDGAERYGRSDAGGNVELAGLVAGDYVLRVGKDDTGDHRADRAAVVTATLAVVPFGKGPFLAPQDQLTSALPGDVTLDPTGNISADVENCPVDALCRVVVYRDVVFADGHVVAGAVEQGGVFSGGLFQLTNVTAGAVHVVAYAWPRPLATSPLQQAIAAAGTVTDFAVVDVDVVAGDTVVVDLSLAPVAGDVATTVELKREPALVERATGQIALLAPGTTTEVGAGFAAIDGAVADVEVPVSVFALSAAIDGDGEFGLVHIAGAPGLPPITFELANLAERACRTLVNGGDEVEDCDGDGDVDDADDDDDGQPDADEPGCDRLGLGTDLDRDCLCDVVDPFPACASNDPVACELVDLPDCAAQ